MQTNTTMTKTMEQLKDYFKIGRIVVAHIGYDKVLEFNDLGNGNWNVKVQECDINGNVLAMPRFHSTFPPIPF